MDRMKSIATRPKQEEGPEVKKSGRRKPRDLGGGIANREQRTAATEEDCVVAAWGVAAFWVVLGRKRKSRWLILLFGKDRCRLTC
jgi:hypothetical protein